MFHQRTVSYTRACYQLPYRYVDKSSMNMLLHLDIVDSQREIYTHPNFNDVLNVLMFFLNVITDQQIVDCTSCSTLQRTNQPLLRAIVIEDILVTLPSMYYDQLSDILVNHVKTRCKPTEGCLKRINDTVDKHRYSVKTSLFNLIDCVCNVLNVPVGELFELIPHPLSKTYNQLLQLPTTPLCNELQDPKHLNINRYGSSDAYYRAIGRDAERICTEAVCNIIRKLNLNVEIESNTTKRRLACCDIRLITRNHIILIEIKNTLRLIVESYDLTSYVNGPMPNGDINKFERDLKVACVKHPQLEIHGLLLSLSNDSLNGLDELPSIGVVKQNEVIKVPKRLVGNTPKGHCGELVMLDNDKRYTMHGLVSSQCNEQEIALYILQMLSDEDGLVNDI